MFYDKEEIDDTLKCPKCHERYFEPKVLPCGESLCYICISNVYDQHTNGLVCPVCSNFHKSSSKDEFPTNKILSKMLEIKSNEVYRSKSVFKLKSYLENIKYDYETLVQSQENSSETIKDFFGFIQDDVQLVKESNIEYIKKYSEEIMHEIDNFRNECLEKAKLGNNANIKKEINDSKQEVYDFYTKWSSYLKNFEINDDDIAEASTSANSLKIKIKKLGKKLQSNLYGGKLMHFNVNENVSKYDLLGKIDYKRISTNYFDDELNFKRTYTINIKNMITTNDSSDFSMCQIRSNLFVVSIAKMNEINRDGFLDLYFFDKNATIIKSFENFVKHLYDHSSYQSIRSKIVCSHNKIALFSISSEKRQNEMSQLVVFQLPSYDFKKIEINFKIKFISCNETRIFCLCELKKQLGIEIYDWNLILIKRVGQNESDDLPFFIPLNTSRVHVSKDKIFFLDLTKLIYVINANDGNLEKKFQLSEDDFIIFDDDAILSYDKVSKKLKFYDYCEEKKKEKIIEMKDSVEKVDHYGYYERERSSSKIKLVSKSSDNDLLFLDSQNWIAYLYSCND